VPRDDYQWYVSYEIFVPRKSIFPCRHTTAASHSPTLTEESISRQPTAESTGASRRHVSGNTTNGGVNVVLTGARWDGEERTSRHTRGVNVLVPDNYSAHLETGNRQRKRQLWFSGKRRP